MIEVIYKEEKMTADEEVSSFTIPRNIRQVGLIGETFRIYMEDYVYTFLKKLSQKKEPAPGSGRLAILKGETHWKHEITYIFVRGAVLADATEASAEQIVLSEKDWNNIHQEEETYFPGDETVGWFYTEQDLPMRMSSTFDSVHLKYFGSDKICMLMDPTEREEAFFRYENSSLIRQCGYYLYYEKNPRMQTYMIDKKQELSDVREETAKDEAVKAFRKRIEETAEEDKHFSSRRMESGGFLSYAATACLAFAVLAAGLNFYRSYRQLNEADQPVQSASSESVVPAAVTEEPSEEQKETERWDAENSDESRQRKISDTKSDTESDTKSDAKSDIKSDAKSNLKSDAEKDSEKTMDADQTTGENTDADQITEKSEDTDRALGEDPVADPVTDDAPEADSVTKKTENTDQPEEETTEQDVSAAVPMHESYVIRPGDTLFQICLEHYGSLDRLQKLCQLNGISENDVIYPGEILVLP